MKKVLLTTSALTLLAGAAAAEVSVGGDGRMGVMFNATAGTNTIDYRYRVKFNASGETDGGLTFGASTGIRLDDSDSTLAAGNTYRAPGAQLIWGPKVYIGNGTVTVSVGNTAGAIESHSGIWNGIYVGYSGMNFAGILFVTNNSSTTQGVGNPQAHVAFSLGNVNIAASMPINTSTLTDTEVAANFSLGAGSIGVGYDTGNNSGTSAAYITASFDLGSANVFAGYVAPSAGSNAWQLGASTSVGAGTAKGYVASIAGTTRWGLGYNQSLGGGASLGVGIESNGTSTFAEAGVGFKF